MKPKKSSKPAAKKAPAAVKTAPEKGVAAPKIGPIDMAGIKAPGRLELIDPTKIELNPHNPRQAPADAEAQKAFEESIATQGVLEPILVRPNTAGGVVAGRMPYQLVAGERRFKAALKAIQGKRLPADYRIPATVKALDNRQALVVALTENLARADMHPLDESEAFAKLADNAVTTAEIAAAVNRTQRLVQQRIKVAKDLTPEGKAALRAGKIGFAQAHAIAQIPEEKLRNTILREVLGGGGWKNEEWISRRWQSVKRSREESKRRRKEDKKNPEAAAERKLRSGGHNRRTERLKPGADGVFAWPTKEAQASAYGHIRGDEFEGEVLEIELLVIEVDDKRDVAGARWQAGKMKHADVLRIADALPREKLYRRDDFKRERAVLEQIIDQALGAEGNTEAFNRKLAVDISDATDRLIESWTDADKKVRNAVIDKLHKKLAKILAPPAPAATPAQPLPATGKGKLRAEDAARAAGPVAVAAVSAPLTQRLEIPAAAPDLGPDAMLMTTAGMALIAAAASKKSRSEVAAKEGLPDVVVVAKGGRSFFYTFLYEVPAETKKAA